MKTKPIALLALLLLVVAASSLAAGHDLSVKSLETKANQVRVLVGNSGAKAHGGTVHLQVTLNGSTVTASQPVSVPAKGETSVVFTFESRVTAVISVGIIEDPDPIP